MATRASAVNTSHTPSTKLEDQAATAALYVTKHERNKSSDGTRFLDGDKLSSAGAAASLKYANPKDLPSFPSAGLRKDDSAAGAAASLGWANQKSFEHWKPDPSSSASKAAILAKDYKAPPLWQPEQSANGAKAAILAAKDGGKVEIWKPEASAWGNSAANQAFKSDRKGGLSPKIDYGYTAIGRQGSLMAATGAMSGSRKRSDSNPEAKPTYPDEANATTNALSAATHANQPARKARAEYSVASGSSPFTNMPKEMFTSHPPIATEVDEKRRSDILHASAVAMAKQMYNLQQKQIDQTANAQRSAGQNAAVSAHGRQLSKSSATEEAPPMRFTSLQEAAQKLAQERLAKLHDEHAQNREYRDYYGEDSRPTSRLSVRGRVRRRASSDGTLDEDKEQSQRIRAQMSLFSSNLSQVDAKKRQKDREALMAVAQRNVTASLHGMDERVFKETGKVSPSMLNEWEIKAHAAAQKNSDTRMENYGKVNIGGGKYVDQSTVDAAAARNVQPVLDEINAKAEKERVRLAELKLDQETSKRTAETQKAREKELKEINKKLKEQDKEEGRLRKEEEKAAKAEQKRTAKEEKRKVKEAPAAQDIVAIEPTAVVAETETASPIETDTAVVVDAPVTAEPVLRDPAVETPFVEQRVADRSVLEKPVVEKPIVKEPVIEEPVEKSVVSTEESTRDEAKTPTTKGYVAPAGMRTSMEMQTRERLDDIIKEGEKSAISVDSSKGVKGWFKTKFRRQSKTQKPDLKGTANENGVVGGAALAEAGDTSADTRPDPETETEPITSTTKDIEPRKSSMEEVALARPSTTHEDPVEAHDKPVEAVHEERTGRSKRRASSVSSVSALEEGQDLGKEVSKDDEFEEARDHFDNDLAPPPTFPTNKSVSPVRDSKFHEVM